MRVAHGTAQSNLGSLGAGLCAPHINRGRAPHRANFRRRGFARRRTRKWPLGQSTGVEASPGFEIEPRFARLRGMRTHEPRGTSLGSQSVRPASKIERLNVRNGEGLLKGEPG